MTKTFTAPDQDYANSGWIQALMGANDPVIQQSRLNLKRHLDMIDILCSLTTIREKADQLPTCIPSLWKFAHENELGWLLKAVPSLQREWTLDSNELFTIEHISAPELTTTEQWAGALGIVDWSTPVIMKILSGDFVSWQRRVARQGSNAPVGFTFEVSTKSMLELKAKAEWKANQWTDGTWRFSLDGQPNMDHSIEEPVVVIRPDIVQWRDDALLAIQSNDEKHAKKRTRGPMDDLVISDWVSWCDSVPNLLLLHESVLSGNETKCSKTFRSIWATVWPMLYCKRKRLKRGACSLVEQRRRLDICLKAEPQTVVWIAIFGELYFQATSGDGLGVCAKYVDRFQ
jgi:hypothetical protein